MADAMNAEVQAGGASHQISFRQGMQDGGSMTSRRCCILRLQAYGSFIVLGSGLQGAGLLLADAVCMFLYDTVAGGAAAAGASEEEEKNSRTCQPCAGKSIINNSVVASAAYLQGCTAMKRTPVAGNRLPYQLQVVTR
jgi:hypothetical protein